MKKKIAITGVNGTIGTVLLYGLNCVQITPLAKPTIDVRDFRQVADAIVGVDVIIHLAWDTKKDNHTTLRYNSENTLMTYNVYQAALQQKIPRVIMASSVHADRFDRWSGPQLLSPNKIPIPDSPYGAEKVFMESLGRYYYATEGIEVVCVRFGGVNRQDIPDDRNPLERSVYFSHKDCSNLIQAIIEAKKIPNNYLLMYGVSDNIYRLHDVQNPLGS